MVCRTTCFGRCLATYLRAIGMPKLNQHVRVFESRCQFNLLVSRMTNRGILEYSWYLIGSLHMTHAIHLLLTFLDVVRRTRNWNGGMSVDLNVTVLSALVCYFIVLS